MSNDDDNHQSDKAWLPDYILERLQDSEDATELLSDSYLNPAELCTLLKINPSTLLRWRRAGRGPKVIRLSTRSFLYARSDVQAWLESIRSNDDIPANTIPDEHTTWIERRRKACAIARPCECGCGTSVEQPLHGRRRFVGPDHYPSKRKRTTDRVYNYETGAIVDGIRHNRHRYMQGCRCDICVTTHNDYCRNWCHKNPEKLSVIVHRYNNNITHSGPHDGGKIAWYVAGCRCWDCRQAYFNRISTDKTLDEARIEV